MAIVSAMRRATDFRLGSEAGVTLVEMIVAIVVTGILVALASMFGRNQIEAYFDVTNRAALTDAADTAAPHRPRPAGGVAEQRARQWRLHRVRPRAMPAATAQCDPCRDRRHPRFHLAADSSFDVPRPTVAVAAGEQLVVYNLGIPGADVLRWRRATRDPAGGVGATRQRRLHSERRAHAAGLPDEPLLHRRPAGYLSL